LSPFHKASITQLVFSLDGLCAQDVAVDLAQHADKSVLRGSLSPRRIRAMICPSVAHNSSAWGVSSSLNATLVAADVRDEFERMLTCFGRMLNDSIKHFGHSGNPQNMFLSVLWVSDLRHPCEVRHMRWMVIVMFAVDSPRASFGITGGKQSFVPVWSVKHKSWCGWGVMLNRRSATPAQYEAPIRPRETGYVFHVEFLWIEFRRIVFNGAVFDTALIHAVLADSDAPKRR
jgi:hypothetical protein